MRKVYTVFGTCLAARKNNFQNRGLQVITFCAKMPVPIGGQLA